MSLRKSIYHATGDGNTTNTTLSSPLRRRCRTARPDAASMDLQDNDDDAELQRRRSKILPATPTGQNTDRRRSLSLGLVDQLTQPQIAECVAQCIKLNAENKINKKNAFSLQMIDFMTYMIKKRDDDMSNLRVAGTSLEVSTKIYGYRVDGFHTDILNMVSGLDKQEKREGQRDNEDLNSNTGETNDLSESQDTRESVKKKRKSKQKILVPPESLHGKIETTSLMTHGEGDSQTTDMLYQAMLPFHANCGLYLNPFNDVILDIVDPRVEDDINNTIGNFQKIVDISNWEMCPSFANFKMMGWSPDEEESLSQSLSQSSNVENAFQFDLDASLPVDNDLSNHSRHFIDMDEETENIDRCQRENRPTENLVDFREVVQTSHPSNNFEYSYLQNTFDVPWVGPSYWKLKFPARNLTDSRSTEKCHQQGVKRRKEVQMIFDDDTMKSRVESDDFKIVGGQLTMLQAKTIKLMWNSEKITLPQDFHYTAARSFRYFLRPDVLTKQPERNEMDATHIDDSVANYDYNNENDKINYCPNIDNERQDGADDYATDGGDLEEDVCIGTQAFTGDNLVEAPKLTNKVFIQYSQRAKKIDMRQLKKTIWKKLSNHTDDEKNKDLEGGQQNSSDKVDGSKQFSEIYQDLPKMLTKSNAESLSVPIAFISLLHLANEKCLKILESDDLTDLTVTQG